MRFACLHTAAVHQLTFTALFQEQAPSAQLIHVVREDLLAQAQINGVNDVTDDVLEALGGLTTADAVLCTCSTLGPIVDLVGSDKFIRVDRPMMTRAAQLGPHPLLALCLESTKDASLDLLHAEGGPGMSPTVHLVEDAWTHFMDGDLDGYADAIALSVAVAAKDHDCIVLGQASMGIAAPLLEPLGLPVLTSPELAVEATVARVAT